MIKKQAAEFKSVRNNTRDLMHDWITDYLVSGMASRNRLDRSIDWTVGPTGAMVHDCFFVLHFRKPQ